MGEILISKLVLSDKKRFFAFAKLRLRMTRSEGSETLNPVRNCRECAKSLNRKKKSKEDVFLTG